MLDTYIVMFPEYDLFLIISDQMHWSNLCHVTDALNQQEQQGNSTYKIKHNFRKTPFTLTYAPSFVVDAQANDTFNTTTSTKCKLNSYFVPGKAQLEHASAFRKNNSSNPIVIYYNYGYKGSLSRGSVSGQESVSRRDGKATCSGLEL